MTLVAPVIYSAFQIAIQETVETQSEASFAAKSLGAYKAAAPSNWKLEGHALSCPKLQRESFPSSRRVRVKVFRQPNPTLEILSKCSPAGEKAARIFFLGISALNSCSD